VWSTDAVFQLVMTTDEVWAESVQGIVLFPMNLIMGVRSACAARRTLVANILEDEIG